MEEPLFTLLFMKPDRDQPPVTNYAPVSPLGWDACAKTTALNVGLIHVLNRVVLHTDFIQKLARTI